MTIKMIKKEMKDALHANDFDEFARLFAILQTLKG